jgi:hypothetical protein
MRYNTILVIPIHSGWYLSTRYLITLSKSKKALIWEHENVFSLVVQWVCCWAGRERNNQPLMGAAKVMDGRDKSNRTAAGEGRR